MDVLQLQPLWLLSHIDFDWAGHEDLLVSLLCLRNTTLAWKLLDGVPSITYDKSTMQKLSIGPPKWWLEWLTDSFAEGTPGYWLRDRVATVIAHGLRSDHRRAYIDEFNDHASPYRIVLADCVLPAFDDLSTDELSESAIEYLVTDVLNRSGTGGFRGHVLGRIATESFVNKYLLPLQQNSQTTSNETLMEVLANSGRRHGRRYVAQRLNE